MNLADWLNDFQTGIKILIFIGEQLEKYLGNKIFFQMTLWFKIQSQILI